MACPTAPPVEARADASSFEFGNNSRVPLAAWRPFLSSRRAQRHEHPVPVQQYLALALWSVLLLGQYALTRAVCQVGIPHDCNPDAHPLETMHDFQQLLSLGFILAVLTGVHLPERFSYIFCFRGPRPRGFAFLIIFFGTGPVYGSLDLVPELTHFSLTPSDFNGDPWNSLLLLGVVSLVVLLVGWHFWCAWKHNSWSGFLAYTGSRLAVWLFYAMYLAMVVRTRGATFHLHHYIIGFLSAILAEFNHPVSLILLAIGTGVFVQGISAYEAAPIFDQHQHRHKELLLPQLLLPQTLV